MIHTVGMCSCLTKGVIIPHSPAIGVPGAAVAGAGGLGGAGTVPWTGAGGVGTGGKSWS